MYVKFELNFIMILKLSYFAKQSNIFYSKYVRITHIAESGVHQSKSRVGSKDPFEGNIESSHHWDNISLSLSNRL